MVARYTIAGRLLGRLRGRVCWGTLLVCLVMAASLPAAESSGPDRHGSLEDRPNFVIVLADDLGYGDLGCYGNAQVKTPHLDQFAAQGVRLTDCYAAACNCSPSRTGLLTGRTPYRVGIHNWIPALSPMHVPASEITIATLLRRHGYATCHVGKWHLNGCFNRPEQPQPSDHGFDHWFSTQNNALPCHRNPDNFVRNGKAVGKLSGYSADLVVAEAIRWLREVRDRDRPFFLFVCFHEPHEPIASAERFTRLYADQGARSPFDPAVSSIAAHHGNVTQMDAAFGRLMRSLDEQRLSSSTFVFFTSDNGPAITSWHPHGSAGPLRDKKGSLYEGGIRVPGLVRWPGHTGAGTVCREPISGVDLLPTLCAMARVPLPGDRKLDGTNLLPLFSGRPVRRRVPLYWQFDVARSPAKVAIRQGDWKLLATLEGGGLQPFGDIRVADQQYIKTAGLDEFELYRLSDDPAETRDVAGDFPQRLARLRATLTRMYHDVIAESPTWPEWKWPRLESQRIRQFRESLRKKPTTSP